MKLKTLALAAILALNSQPALSYSTERWMEDLFSNTRRDTPLNKIIIPGSHDSGAYDAQNYSKKAAGVNFPLSKLRDWSETQDLSKHSKQKKKQYYRKMLLELIDDLDGRTYLDTPKPKV